MLGSGEGGYLSGHSSDGRTIHLSIVQVGREEAALYSPPLTQVAAGGRTFLQLVALKILHLAASISSDRPKLPLTQSTLHLTPGIC